MFLICQCLICFTSEVSSTCCREKKLRHGQVSSCPECFCHIIKQFFLKDGCITHRSNWSKLQGSRCRIQLQHSSKWLAETSQVTAQSFLKCLADDPREHCLIWNKRTKQVCMECQFWKIPLKWVSFEGQWNQMPLQLIKNCS